MKKIFSLAMFATVLIYCNEANAKIRRVGYFGIPIPGTDYSTLQSAHDSAILKDTIMLFPGSWSANISKKVVVLGYGYFVTGTGSNGNLQTITGPLTVNITLYAGADSSIYEGLDGLTLALNFGDVVNKVIIRRCNVSGSVTFNDKKLDGWQILQCNINFLISRYFSYYQSSGKVTNLTVNNCYISNLDLRSDSSGQNGQFNNDIIGDSYYGFGNGIFLIKNCIFLDRHNNDANCVYQNNIAVSNVDDQIPSGSGNKNITYAGMNDSVFVGYKNQSTFSNDGRWALKPGSLAKGAGAGGTDCGIFGGNNAYKLSGIPKVPSFYKLSATSTTTSTNPYTITFSVRSNN